MSNDVLMLVLKIGLYVIGIVLVTLFNFLFVKYSNKTKAFDELSQKLPLFIRGAEKLNIQGGKNKLFYVLDLACSFLSPRLKMSVQDVQKKYASLIASQIEDILNTPQKKEVSFNGSKENETTQGL